MKKHAIIPIFIPHLGCPYKCVFCDQKTITARGVPVSEEEIKSTVETWLSTLENMDLDTVELSFYGGSFTAIPIELQTEYLRIGHEYIRSGRVDMLHISTRPDCIDAGILDNLRRFGVRVIELGVQSFDQEVLRRSGRGHGTKAVYDACKLIRSENFSLGIQLMTGLPGSSRASDIESARETAAIKPDLARIYPTVVLKGTPLAAMLESGEYAPTGLKSSVETVKDMYRILTDAGIEIMRVGLKSTDLINAGSDLGGSYHPSFRQLVESMIAREDMEQAMINAFETSFKRGKDIRGEAVFASVSRCVSAMPGYKGMNRKYFKQKYPGIRLSFKSDPGIADGKYIMLEYKAYD